MQNAVRAIEFNNEDISPPQDEGVDLASRMQHRSESLRAAATARIQDIRKVTAQSRFLALNAMIEASRAGELGAGFSVVAREVREVSEKIEAIAAGLDTEIGTEVDRLIKLCRDSSLEMRNERLVDLALNAVELIDRNLYERTCDVRWWATDSAITECLAKPSTQLSKHASNRLGVILNAYTVYLDLWIIDLEGNVITNGRPGRYPMTGKNVRGVDWFEKAARLKNGDEYSVANIAINEELDNAQVATYCASIREHGDVNGRPLGVLAIHFDWEPQARSIVKGVRLSPEEQERYRVLLVDASGLVIASSEGASEFRTRINLDTQGQKSRHYEGLGGRTTAFHLTPGYETYAGLGWYGVITGRFV